MIVTSATLDGEKFSSFFTECPVLTISGRCFPVQVSHLLDKPEQPYLQLAIDKALDIHLYEPLGDILVFLTGQAEIEQVSWCSFSLVTAWNTGLNWHVPKPDLMLSLDKKN